MNQKISRGAERDTCAVAYPIENASEKLPLNFRNKEKCVKPQENSKKLYA
jgi:hypothetical protein